VALVWIGAGRRENATGDWMVSAIRSELPESESVALVQLGRENGYTRTELARMIESVP
jgi:hypothetical protein